MGFGGKKDVFEDLDSDFKDAIASSTAEDINKRISKVAQDEEQNQANKKTDLNLAELKAKVAELSKPYDDATRDHKYRISCAAQVLKDKDIINVLTAIDLEKYIGEVAKDEERNQQAKGSDQSLESAKNDAADAAAQYRDGTKMNRLRIQYCLRCLGDKGAE